MQKKKCKTNKTKDNIPDLKKKIKSLQDQVTRQDDMINAMAAQIAEIVRERKTEESERTKLIDSATGQADLGAICGTIHRIDNELNELKDQHSSCKNIGKTIDELGSLCAAAMVAAGTKLNTEIAGRQVNARSESRNPTEDSADAVCKPQESSPLLHPTGKPHPASS